MYRPYAMVRELAKVNPLPLLDIKDKRIIQYAESLLPFSIGIEFECCHEIYGLDKMAKKEIPYLIAVNCDMYEKRLRIPKGIKGLICLYHLSLFMKKYCTLNPKSGLHYHVDFTSMKEFWEKMHSDYQYEIAFIKGNNKWIIETLKSWGYRGTFNTMAIAYNCKQAVKFHSEYKTVEFRIGEMTFDYALMYKRISHCCNIVSKLKADLLSPKMAPKVEKGSKLNKTTEI